jgi:hypothetical protein
MTACQPREDISGKGGRPGAPGLILEKGAQPPRRARNPHKPAFGLWQAGGCGGACGQGRNPGP